MGTVSRGFRGRRRPTAELPPGQYLVEDFPVLSAGPTPDIDLQDWEFAITSETDEQRRWDWAGFRALPSEPVTVDLHCVTHWSKLGTSWEGVSLDTLLAEVDTSANFALAESYGGYTTNLPLEDLTDHKAWIAFRYDGQELEPEHGGPARLLVPHLYLWKSAKWVRGIRLLDTDEPGFWESLGYHNYGDPWQEQRYWGRLMEVAMTGSDLWSDGNALAGPLQDVVRVEVTTAIGRCTHCGRTGPMAEVRVFDHAPGVVARCPVCGQVLVRLVRDRGRAWLDLRGLSYLQLPVPKGT
jgi:DMSO/TMAO reductase YedYZ molybdopterin-dependent catalytic subunit